MKISGKQKFLCIFLVLGFFNYSVSSVASMFGEENVPLWKLVAGQILELERLLKNIELAKDTQKFLKELNEGIEQTVKQIESIEEIYKRVKALDPTAVKSLSELNDLVQRAKSAKMQTEELMGLKVDIADEIISASALQTDTTYKMGQEMVDTGGTLANESRRASPGRAAQITASASSAQMLAQGVLLQTFSQIMQVQTMTLEFQKSQVEKTIKEEQERRNFFKRELRKQK